MARKNKGVAWYDAPGKGWLRDIWVILHFPYTMWHLSYVVIGAALAPVMNWGLLGWTILAFALAMCIGGHALDELNGRPLKTTLPKQLLWGIALTSIAGAVAIGLIIGVRETLWVIPCIVFGGLIVFAYNMEWPSESMKRDFLLSSLPTGFFHRDPWFGLAWGAFPVITAYIAQAHTLSWSVIYVALFAYCYSMAQRKLSLQARFFRRKVDLVQGSYYLGTPIKGGPLNPETPIIWEIPITKETIIGPAELALEYMTWAVILAALGLLYIHY